MYLLMTPSFDINNACFLDVLEACHSRIVQIQKEDEKRHEMDADINLVTWRNVLEEELMPAIERIIYWEPSDDEMMSSFGTKWHDGL